MSRSVGAEHARQNLPELLDRARDGEVTIITKRGRPYAALVPVDRISPERPAASFAALAGSGSGLWSDDPTEYVRRIREEWP